ncbi:hypothetical protein ARMGADRAFT_1036633 [Armillaria gallica]|uniref:Uncharacterized protein n=1 Tax=Armillaria gallica TaxID=47427 RepID=A0A2H3CTG9_ARMGA|nr:hypothetical protein ARMGADRAFT_1036633 [Armillaria gallica]
MLLYWMTILLSPLILPVKMLMPIPKEDKMLKYEYFVQFDPVSYYRPYHAVIDLLMPYWHNKNKYSNEEVADLLKQASSVATLKHENLIDSCIGMSICNWVICIHDTLPCQLRILNWHHTIAHMVPEMLTCLSPNVLFPGKDSFNTDNPATSMESYLLQHTIPTGALLWPGLVANNKDFPGYMFDHFPMPLPGAADNEEILIFESPKIDSLSTSAHPQASLSTTPALLLPPQSTCPQKTPVSLVPPISASLSCGLQDMASSIQDLYQALLTPVLVWVFVFQTLPVLPHWPIILQVGDSSLPKLLLTLELCLLMYHQALFGYNDQTPSFNATPHHPCLPCWDKVSAFIEKLPSPTDFMNVDALLLPLRVYHPVTGAPLHSRSLVVHSPLPKASSPVSKPVEASASASGNKSQPKEKMMKNKGKKKKKTLKRKHAPGATAPSEPGPSKLTCTSAANGSVVTGPSIKKPWFSPKKAFKRKASCKTMKHNSCTELKDFHFEDLIMVSNKFFNHKNGTYGAHSSCYTYYVCASDHYEKTCLPCAHRQANCTWNNWFSGADYDQCQEGHHRGCSACYTACEMNVITLHLTTFTWYSIPALCHNIMQLHSINHKLEHIDYLYHSCLCACNCVIHDITESLNQFASAEGGNKLIDDLSRIYCEVCSFIIDDGLWHSLGLSLDLPEGPEYTPSNNDAHP